MRAPAKDNYATPVKTVVQNVVIQANAIKLAPSRPTSLTSGEFVIVPWYAAAPRKAYININYKTTS